MDPIDVAEFALSAPEIDPNKASPARIYDFWLGGSQNFAVDRELGRRMADTLPSLPAAARANRAFLGRIVHHLTAVHGIDQFLDLGSGVPTMHNVHEVAREINPRATVAYVDVDPVAVEHARMLLSGISGVSALLADLREPESVLRHPLLAETLDLDRPVAVLMFAVLHFMPNAREIVEAYADLVAPGSFIALSHAETQASTSQEQASAATDYTRATGVSVVSRSPAELEALLAGLTVESPGVVRIQEWRTETGSEDTEVEDAEMRMYGALARKPDTYPADAVQ
jgi:SAM-dependent methyltransferase